MSARKQRSSFTPRFIIGIVLLVLTLYILQKLFETWRSNKHVPGDKAQTERPAPADSARLINLPLPAITKDDEIVKHTCYTLSYSEKDEEPKWVAYRLTDWMVGGHEKRTGDFREDPFVTTGSAMPVDYRRSGYDKGHICPAADMRWSRQAMSETFYMSNMTPQNHGFNDGIWNHLENRVREWARKYGVVYIAAGPILDKCVCRIGRCKVSVPEKFYKVILAPDGNTYKAIGFVIPNQNLHESYYNYAVSIDSVQKLTGIDFFPALNDTTEKRIESKFSIEQWQ